MTKLECKILTRNRVNQMVKETALAMITAVKPFVGKKVVLQTGDLSAKFKEVIKKFTDNSTPKKQIYRVRSDYSLTFCVRTSHTDELAGTFYAEQPFYLGELNDGVLENLQDIKYINDFRTDYKAEDILAAREELKITEQKVREIESKLYVFGRYDT